MGRCDDAPVRLHNAIRERSEGPRLPAIRRKLAICDRGADRGDAGAVFLNNYSIVTPPNPCAYFPRAVHGDVVLEFEEKLKEELLNWLDGERDGDIHIPEFLLMMEESY